VFDVGVSFVREVRVTFLNHKAEVVVCESFSEGDKALVFQSSDSVRVIPYSAIESYQFKYGEGSGS
jgi:hypothetical protein